MQRVWLAGIEGEEDRTGEEVLPRSPNHKSPFSGWKFKCQNEFLFKFLRLRKLQKLDTTLHITVIVAFLSELA